jgi:hypothetical protein
MFKTPCCNVKVAWWKAISSRPMDPVKCPHCGTKYHDEAIRKYRRSIWCVMILALIFLLAAVAPGLRQLFYIGVILFLIALILIAYNEVLVVKAGVLTKTTLQKQKSDLKLIVISIGLMAIGILYEVYRAL